MTRLCAALTLAIVLAAAARAETLGSVLRSRHVPTSAFSDAELAQPITSWAASGEEKPFLLAYYGDDGSGALSGPLHTFRYDPASHDLRRADFSGTTAAFDGALRMGCLGSVLAIGEQHGVIHIDTHINPSAGCLLLLTPQLTLRTTLSGWLLGMLGEDYAIVERSEIHFASVHPMRIAVYDLRHDRLAEVYPPAKDRCRRDFSLMLQSHMPGDDWCRIHNASCDPGTFDAGLAGPVAVNEAAGVFGFEARYDAGGFGEKAEEQVRPLVAVYVYRLLDGRWEHRGFLAERLASLFGVETVDDLITRKPLAAFQTPAAP